MQPGRAVIQMFKGIDVSVHNGNIDWKAVKADGIQFAMIRASYGWDNPNQIDKCLAANVAGCEAAGIPYGFYHYSYATTAAEAKKEANFFLQTVNKYKPTMPLVYDIEDKTQADLGRNILTDMCLSFCTILEAGGYYAAIYANLDWVRNRLDMERLSKIDLWLAQWASKPTYSGNFGMWQYSATGKVNGISGNVDMNYAYKDYPAIIKRTGLNNAVQGGTVETISIEEYNALQVKYDGLRGSLQKLLKEYE